LTDFIYKLIKTDILDLRIVVANSITNWKILGSRHLPPFRPSSRLLPVPHLQRLHALDLLLQLQHTVQQRLRRWRAAGHININGNNTITASHHRIRVVVVAAAVGAATHRDYPPGFGHLVVHFAERGRHLVGQRAGNNDTVGLPRGGSEDDTITIHVVTWSGDVHHLYGATGQTEGQRPDGGLATPVQDVVETGDRPVGPAKEKSMNTERLKSGCQRNLPIALLGTERRVARLGRWSGRVNRRHGLLFADLCAPQSRSHSGQHRSCSEFSLQWN
jgi:hypothetical protein